MLERDEYIRRWQTAAGSLFRVAAKIGVVLWALLGVLIYWQPQGRPCVLAWFLWASVAMVCGFHLAAGAYAWAKAHDAREYPSLFDADYHEPWLR